MKQFKTISSMLEKDDTVNPTRCSEYANAKRMIEWFARGGSQMVGCSGYPRLPAKKSHDGQVA